MPRHPLGDFDASAVGEVIRNPRGADSVATDGRFNSRIRSTAPDHVPDIDARHRLAGEDTGFADCGAEQRPLPIPSDSRRVDIGVQLVVTGLFVQPAVFLA
jgi:hypothetical protein